MAKHRISLGAALLGINALGLGQVRFSFELCCLFQYLKHLYGYTDFLFFGPGWVYYHSSASCVKGTSLGDKASYLTRCTVRDEWDSARAGSVFRFELVACTIIYSISREIDFVGSVRMYQYF